MDEEHVMTDTAGAGKRAPSSARAVPRVNASRAPYAVTVDRRVWAAAKAARRPGTSLLIVSETVVRIVNDPAH
jgi:hypothetical protein